MTNTGTDDRLTQIHQLLDSKADGKYGLHDVTQRQHALQAAMFAERDGQRWLRKSGQRDKWRARP